MKIRVLYFFSLDIKDSNINKAIRLFFLSLLVAVLISFGVSHNFSLGVIKQVEDVIKYPVIKGATVSDYQGDSGGFGVNISAFYNFESKGELFSGLAELCDHYSSLDWPESSGDCSGKVYRDSLESPKYLIRNGSYTFCIKDGARINIFYYPGIEDLRVIKVVVFARKLGPVCSRNK